MTLRCVGAIVVCTLLASACATEPDPFYQERRAALDPRNVAACKARGGRTEPVCLAGVLACVIHHRDAGRSCTDSSQCRGKCVIDMEGFYKQFGRWPEPDEETPGICEKDDDPCGS